MNRKTIISAFNALTIVAAAACANVHAGVIEYTDKTAFDNNATSTTTIDFTGLSGSGYYAPYGYGFNTSGVGFSAAGNLYVFTPTFFGSSYTPAQAGNYLNNYSYGAINVNFNQGVTAFSFDTTSLFGSGMGAVVLSNGQSYTFLYNQGSYTFLGFTSDTPITGYTVNAAYTVLDDVRLGAATSPASVPEPGSLALVGLGMLGFLVARRKRA